MILSGIAKDIVDPKIRAIVLERCKQLKEDGVTTTKTGTFKMESGVPIRRVRIKKDFQKLPEVRTQPIPSKKDYKNKVYAEVGGDSNFRMAIFRNKEGELDFELENSFHWAQNHKKPDYMPRDKQPGFIGYVKPGAMALTYPEGNPEEVWELSARELRNRLYKVVKFSATVKNDKVKGEMTLRFHTEARKSTDLEKALKEAGASQTGSSKINLENPHLLLRLQKETFLSQVLFEGVHFRMAMDGTIKRIEGAEQA